MESRNRNLLTQVDQLQESIYALTRDHDNRNAELLHEREALHILYEDLVKFNAAKENEMQQLRIQQEQQ